MKISKILFNFILFILVSNITKLYSQFSSYQKNILVDSCISAIPGGLCSTNSGRIVLCGTADGPTKKDICLASLFKDDPSGLIMRISFQGSSCGSDVVSTLDGNLVLLGQTDSNIVLIKIDSTGNILRSKKYTSLSVDKNISFCKTSDEGFGVAGNSFIPGIGQSLNIIRTDSAGQLLWNKGYYLSQESLVYSISQTIDGGFILTGETLGGIFLCKIDSFGNSEWVKSYTRFPLSLSVNGFKVKQSNAGNFYVVGEIEKSVNVTDGLIIKTDSVGNIIWSKFCHNHIFTSLYDFNILDDLFYASGRVYAGNNGNDALLFCTDTAGNFLWARNFGTNDYEFANRCIILDKGFSLSASFSGGNTFVVIKADSVGFSGCEEDSIEFLIDTVQLNTFSLSITSYTFAGDTDIIPKVYVGGTLTYVCQPDHIESIESSRILIYPNPINELIMVELPEKISSLNIELYNSMGKVLKKEIY